MTNNQKSDCKGFYEVSGYTTKDGKHVDDYIRQCWKHGGGGITEGWNEGENSYHNRIFEKSNSNPKKTETNIKNIMKIIETLLKQKEVSNNDISSIRNSLKSSVGSLCNDIESISYRRSQQPENPTIESVEMGKTIEQDRKQTLDNATNVITSINLAQNALKRNFDSVRMNSPEYNKKLYEYVRQSDELKEMSNSVMDLFQEAKSLKKNSMNTVNRIRQEIGLIQNNMSTSNYNGTTGNAVDVGMLTGFASSIEDEKRKYQTDDPTGQRVFKIIKDVDSKLNNMNEDLNNLNNVKTPITKTQVLQKLEDLKTLIEITNKYYPKAEKIDKYNKNGVPYKKDELIYWFDRVINKFPKTINNTNRLVEKYAYYNPDKVKNIKKLKENMYETERIFPENLKSKITLFTKISSKIIYLINRIIDNINYRRNPELKEIEEIDPKYGKKPKMSEENEAIYEYALTHPYDPEYISELKEHLIKWEGYSNEVYDDAQPNRKLKTGDIILGNLTIGIGHNGPIDGQKLYIGMPHISDEKIEELFLADINIAKKSVIKKVKVPLTQEQYDMLVSASFNTGGEIIKNEEESTLLRLLNQGDYIGASEEFDKWIFFNKKPNEGLINRRSDEKTKFNRILFYINN